MNLIETLAYAGLGLAAEANDKAKSKFDELVESNSGQDLTEYNLRRIGSDLEHFIRSLLQKGEISYNLGARVLNYSMGLPRVDSQDSEGKY